MTLQLQPLQLPLFSDSRPAGAVRAPLTRAALYDAVYEARRDDLRVYLGLAALARGPVLELGAGTGRLLAPLLAKGVDAVGLERDPDALLVGGYKLAALGGVRFSRRLIAGDMTAFRLEQRFSLIIVACNTLSLLVEEAELQAMLAHVRQHLQPDGALVFDVSHVEGHSWHRAPYTWQGPEEGVWVAGVAASTRETGTYDPGTRRCNVTRDFELADGRRARSQTQTHQRSLEHLCQSLRSAGLEPGLPIDELGGPLTPDSTLAFVRSEASG